MYLCTTSESNNFTENNVTTYGSSAYAIYLNLVDDNILLNNNITTDGTYSLRDINANDFNTFKWNNSGFKGFISILKIILINKDLLRFFPGI